MNIIFNSLLDNFSNLELPEISDDTVWYGATAANLLLIAGMAYKAYSYYSSPPLKVIYGTENNYNTLEIRVSIDRNTLPESVKKQLLEKIQAWQGPNDYRFLPSKGLLLSNGLDNLANSSLIIIDLSSLATLKNDFYLTTMNTANIGGHVESSIDNFHCSYSFKIFANDNSPPEILDGVIENILNLFKARLK